MDTKILIEVEQLYRYYGHHLAVDAISFELSQGEVLGFLGPNGAGKSTTMQMITGNLAPSAGRITINGIDLLDRPRLAKAEIGYLPEQPPVYVDLTVDEYLLYCAKLHRVSSRQRGKAMARAKQRCGLEQVSRRLIGNLSKGYQQRVGIAQAIIHEPDVIILDEPTVGLDPIQIREIRDLILELGTRHSVILSTHILPEVQAVCNRVNILHQGRIVYDDANTETPEHKQLIVQFGRDIDVHSLLELSSISNVIRQDKGRYVIQHHSDSSPASTIASMAVENQWGLMELTPSEMGLEHIFISLTQGEEQDDSRDQNAEQAA